MDGENKVEVELINQREKDFTYATTHTQTVFF